MAALPKQLQVMPSTLQFLALTGFWGSGRKFHRFGLMYCYGVMVMMLPRLVFGVGSDNLSEILKSIAEVIFLSSIFVPALVFAGKRGTFEKVVTGLGKIFQKATIGDPSDECFEMIVQQNAKIKKFGDFLTIYMSFAAFGYCIPSLFVSYRRYFTNDGTNPIVFVLPMEQEFYGLQIRTNLAHYNIFMIFSLLAYMTCSYFTLVKLTLPLFTIRYCSMTYRLVAIRIRNLAKYKSSIADLKDIIELHQLAFNVTALVEEMCHIPVALEFLACVLVWSLIMFYVSTTIGWEIFSIIIVVFSSLLEAYCYSYLGSELSEQAVTVGAACYELPWYESSSAELTLACKQIIQRSLKVTRLTGLKLFSIDLNTYGSIINISYSYYLILKDVLNIL